MSLAQIPSKAGIIELNTGERHIPSSTRSDGTKRKEIKIRPGYKPLEDVEVYKNRSAESWKCRGKRGIPGAEGLSDVKDEASAASTKNAKRREARKKAKEQEDKMKEEANGSKDATVEQPIDPDAMKEKIARNLKKKLKQARELKNKERTGSNLLPEQLLKVTRINELIRELKALGLNTDLECESKTIENGKDEKKHPAGL